MKISGVGVDTTIDSVDSATQITLTANLTADASGEYVFIDVVALTGSSGASSVQVSGSAAGSAAGSGGW